MVTQCNINDIITALCQQFFMQPLTIRRGHAARLSECLAMALDLLHLHQGAGCLEMAGEDAHG